MGFKLFFLGSYSLPLLALLEFCLSAYNYEELKTRCEKCIDTLKVS